MIEIEIDGKKLEAPQGSMIIEVADANHINIPRFCYHKKLSVAANCRMCLVEVEKAPKTVPACATPITPGMKVFTNSAKARDSQRAVMEFLLINHPLDCPICDQGGQCELQDNAIGYGNSLSDYHETKRVVQDKDIGPLVATDLTRCIQCTRCIRFGQEIAGVRELGATDRGEYMTIGTYVEHSLTSEVSANIIDLCPVGALTSKPFRFTARPWELDQHLSIAPHDALGSNIQIHTRRDQVMRVVPHENENINEVWLSDRDRFSYLAIKSNDRLLSPMIKRNGQWHATDWQTALDIVVKSLQSVKQKYGADSLHAIISPSCTNEEIYLLHKLWQSLGSTQIDYAIRATSLNDKDILPLPHFDITLPEIEKQNYVLMIGSQISRETPLLALRFRKAALAGAQIDVINPAHFDTNFTLNSEQIVAPQELVQTLAHILKALLQQNNSADYAELLQHATLVALQPNSWHQAVAKQLMQHEKSFIYLGAIAYHHPAASQLRLLVAMISDICKTHWGMYSDGANSYGAALIESHVLGSNNTSPLEEIANKAVLLMNLEPDEDCAMPYRTTRILEQADFVVALTPFKSSYLQQHAHVLLPIATLGETSGSFYNMLGENQSFKGCVTPAGETRPAWKVLRVLGNLFDLIEFSYTSTSDILAEMQQDISVPTTALQSSSLIARFKNMTIKQSEPLLANEVHRFTQWPIYRIDNLVRRSTALQHSGTATPNAAVYLNATTANRLQLRDGQQVIVQQLGRTQLPIVIDQALPDDVALIPGGYTETGMLGESFGKIVINKVA